MHLIDTKGKDIDNLIENLNKKVPQLYNIFAFKNAKSQKEFEDMKGTIKTENINIIPHALEFPLFRGEMKQVVVKENAKEKNQQKEDKEKNADAGMEEQVRNY